MRERAKRVGFTSVCRVSVVCLSCVCRVSVVCLSCVCCTPQCILRFVIFGDLRPSKLWGIGTCPAQSARMPTRRLQNWYKRRRLPIQPVLNISGATPLLARDGAVCQCAISEASLVGHFGTSRQPKKHPFGSAIGTCSTQTFQSRFAFATHSINCRRNIFWAAHQAHPRPGVSTNMCVKRLGQNRNDTD